MALTFADIKDEFLAAVAADKTAKRYASATSYHGASLYAARIGDILGRVLRKHAPMVDISEWDLEELIPQALGLNHSMVSEVCVRVQEEMNTKAGLGIRAIEPKFDGDRAYGIVKELRDNPEFFNIEKTFYDQLTNFTQNVVDDAVRDNAELQSNAGIKAYVVRTPEYGACPWCVDLAGTYDYQDVKDKGNDVWRRHENCRCTIDYVTERSSERVNNYKRINPRK